MPAKHAARGPARSYLPFIKVKLAPICRRKNIVHKKGKRAGEVNIYAVHILTGVPYETCWNLIKYDYSPHVGLGTIAKLCHTLDTTPQELLEYVPQGDAAALYELPRAKADHTETVLIKW